MNADLGAVRQTRDAVFLQGNALAEPRPAGRVPVDGLGGGLEHLAGARLVEHAATRVGIACARRMAQSQLERVDA
jgi:hypothetical protein